MSDALDTASPYDLLARKRQRGGKYGEQLRTLSPEEQRQRQLGFVYDAAFTLATELPKDEPKLEGVLRGIPYVGPLVYSWFGGGAEKYNERLD